MALFSMDGQKKTALIHGLGLFLGQNQGFLLVVRMKSYLHNFCVRLEPRRQKLEGKTEFWEFW